MGKNSRRLRRRLFFVGILIFSGLVSVVGVAFSTTLTLIKPTLTTSYRSTFEYQTGNQTNFRIESYQETLLGFYSQQLVAHGAQLFASTAGSFAFITGLIRKTNTRRGSSMLFVVFGGILLGITIYILLRLILYGALATMTIYYPTDILLKELENSENASITLGEFTQLVSDTYAFGGSFPTQQLAKILENANELKGPHILGRDVPQEFRNLLQNFRGWRQLIPFGLPLCFSLGFLLIYLLFYAFACHTLSNTDATIGGICFLGPALIGMFGAFGWLSSEPWIFVFVLWYALGIVILLRQKILEQARALFLRFSSSR